LDPIFGPKKSLKYEHLLSVEQKLYIGSSVPISANFLITLCSHLDVTCSCYFWFSLRMNIVYNYGCSFSQEKTTLVSQFYCFLVLSLNFSVIPSDLVFIFQEAKISVLHSLLTKKII